MADIVPIAAAGMVRRDAKDAGPIREFLSIVLCGHLYGVELTCIREILSPPPLTPVPRAPQSVMGVCSVRGQLVTVVDLRRQLRLPSEEISRRARILLTESQDEVMGMFVDEVRQVVRLAESDIEPANQALGGDVSEQILGIGRIGAQVIVLLHLTHLEPR